MIIFDFIMMRINHTEWKQQIKHALDGKIRINECEATSHRDCKLGKRFYPKGMDQFGGLLEMQELEQAHAVSASLRERNYQHK